MHFARIAALCRKLPSDPPEMEENENTKKKSNFIIADE